MAPLHIVISALLVLCAALAAVSAWVWSFPGLLALSVVAGYWVTIFAIIVAIGLLVLLGVRAFSGTARALLYRSWLGLVNGVMSVVAYLLLVSPSLLLR